MAVPLDASNRGVPQLNQVTFDETVLKSNFTDHWVVLFCVDWYDPCGEILQHYRALGMKHEDALNRDLLFSSSVRFAEVSCATDKVLCNEQLVDDYPTIVHYNKGERVAQWQTSQGKAAKMVPKLVSWLEAELLAESGPRQAQSQLIQGAQEDEFRKFIRDILKFAAAAISMTVMVLSYGVDMWFTTTATLTAHGAKPANSKTSAESSDTQQDRVARILPEEWSKDRESIEL